MLKHKQKDSVMNKEDLAEMNKQTNDFLGD